MVVFKQLAGIGLALTAMLLNVGAASSQHPILAESSDSDKSGLPGFVISLKQDKLVRGLTPVFWSFLMEALNGARFDDVDHRHGSLTNNTFYVTRDAYDISVTPSKRDPLTMKLRANQVNFGFTSELFTDKVGLIESRGSVEAQFRDVSLEATIRMTTWQGPQRKTLAIIVESADVQLPYDHLDLTIHENFFAKIAEPFRAIYEAELRVKIEQEIEDIVRKAFPRVLNRKIRQIQVPTVVSQDSNLAYRMDWGVQWIKAEKCDPVCYLVGLNGIEVSRDKQNTWNSDFNDEQLAQFEGYFTNSELNDELSDQITKDLSDIFKNAEGTLIALRTQDDDSDPIMFSQIFKTINNVLFGLFKVSLHGEDSIIQQDATIVFESISVQPFAPVWLPQHTTQRLPKLSDAGFFYTETLSSTFGYSRKQIRPVGDMVHVWLRQHYDQFGVVKLLEKMYLPWIYWIFGDKMP